MMHVRFSLITTDPPVLAGCMGRKGLAGRFARSP
jgi:hypothetical protein